MLHVEKMEQESYLVMVTRKGTVKRITLSALKNIRNNGIRAIKMDEDDQLVEVRQTDGKKKILIATHDGMAVCFDENDVRVMGRDAYGVRGIKLRDGDYVVGAARATAGKTVLSITENGYGKRTPVEEYRITHPRGRHPHRRACHPGRHRHALQGGGGPGDLPGSGRAGGGRIHNSRGKCGKPGHSRAGN